MFTQSVFLLLAVCFVQANPVRKEGGPRIAITDIIEQFKPEIEKIHESISNLSNSLSDINIVITSALARLYLVESESDSLLESLTNIVQETISEANEENVDITSCLEAEIFAQSNLEKVIGEAINKMTERYRPQYKKHSKEIEALKQRLPFLITKTDKIIRNCVLQNLLPWQTDKLILCLRTETNKVNEQISRLDVTSMSINDKIHSLFSAMETNIKELIGTVVYNTVTIVENLKECISMLATVVPTEPTELPTEQPTQPETTEEPITTNSEESTEQPTDFPTEQPTEFTTVQTTEEPITTSPESLIEQPTNFLTEQPTEEPVTTSPEPSTEQPTNFSTEQPTEFSTEQPTEFPTEQPTSQTTEEPITTFQPK